MGPLEAAWLGIVQGLTEFFPVSSSGHLVIAETLLGHVGEGVLFEIAVHVGTLVAILAFYRERIVSLISGVLAREPEAWRYAGKLVLATLPAVVAGLTAKPFIESLFGEPRVIVLTLLATGALLLTIRRTQPHARAAMPSWPQAFWIGCAQMLAIAPGISRSGSTLAAALALGVAPLAATEFSFLMAVAAITGAAVLAIPDANAADAATLIACGIGAVTAAVSGLFALRAFVRLLERQRFHFFAYYCFAAAMAFAAYLSFA
ncbi:MAG: undecaprenyl-diphosphate phosphatase [Deltaproteobacteria bacterium]|nr:undecaprenyl-diphosphate phosphatase [Deltaproteobacteria bacterium]MBW2394909.1 undecaprenyl-diphosphate phosphatase [Deltaproteobacteria bacterium]